MDFINIVKNLQNRLEEVEIRYWNNNTIIIIENKVKDFFLGNIKNSFETVVTKDNHYKEWTKNIMSTFWWIPVEFVDDSTKIITDRLIRYWKVLLLRNEDYFELWDKKHLEEYLKLQFNLMK